MKRIPELQNGFDAIGFSQGGVFLRGYIERCNNPPVSSLMTFGSPHNGIAALPLCGKTDFLCRNRNRLFEANVYTDYSQEHIVSAQYYRDPNRYEEYLEKSRYLADVNNERAEKNKTYSENLGSIEKFIMVMFDQDVTVVPKESAVSIQ